MQTIKLTPREQAILDGALRGMSRREQAVILGIAENTVKNFRQSVLAKLNLRNFSGCSAPWGLQ